MEDMEKKMDKIKGMDLPFFSKKEALTEEKPSQAEEQQSTVRNRNL